MFSASLPAEQQLPSEEALRDHSRDAPVNRGRACFSSFFQVERFFELCFAVYPVFFRLLGESVNQACLSVFASFCGQWESAL